VVESLLDVLLPKTDRVVFIQTIVMALFWPVVIVATWGWRREYRVFLYGLAMINIAWFAVRMVH